MDEIPADRHIVLVGLPGAGKTSVGRRLAKELKRPFADSDEQVELHVGRSIPRIFAEDGEDAFRAWETEVLGSLVTRELPLVVASGGGTMVREANRKLVAEHAVVVWLRAGTDFLVGRTDPTHRPLLAEAPEETYRRLAAERTALYTQVADVVVDVEAFHQNTDGKPKNVIARHVAGLVARPVESTS
jgi:shikimate kinase